MRLGNKLQEMEWDLGNGENKIVIHVITDFNKKTVFDLIAALALLVL
jgi:hypothetical protein